MGFQKDVYGISFGFLWGFLPYFYDISMRFLWDFKKTMIFLEDFFGNSMGFP